MENHIDQIEPYEREPSGGELQLGLDNPLTSEQTSQHQARLGLLLHVMAVDPDVASAFFARHYNEPSTRWRPTTAPSNAPYEQALLEALKPVWQHEDDRRLFARIMRHPERFDKRILADIAGSLYNNVLLRR